MWLFPIWGNCDKSCYENSPLHGLFCEFFTELFQPLTESLSLVFSVPIQPTYCSQNILPKAQYWWYHTFTDVSESTGKSKHFIANNIQISFHITHNPSLGTFPLARGKPPNPTAPWNTFHAPGPLDIPPILPGGSSPSLFIWCSAAMSGVEEGLLLPWNSNWLSLPPLISHHPFGLLMNARFFPQWWHPTCWVNRWVCS